MTRTRTENDKAREFEYYWHILYPVLPPPVPEYEFARAAFRKGWAFDCAWPDLRIAVEIDGGNHMAVITKDGRAVAVGHHTTDADYRKRNAATALRWFVFYFTTDMLKKDPAECCRMVAEVIQAEADDNWIVAGAT
jgi:very-short-patch-repair endonuclease